MKKRKIHIWVIVCILSVSGFLLSERISLAASATISLTEPKEVVKSGDTFTVMVLVESSETIGNIEAFVSFDTKMVSFKSGGLYATGGDGLVMISDWNSSGESKRKKYPLTFQAKKNGTCKFEVENNASVYDSSDVSMSVSCVNLSMDIGEVKNDKEETVENPEVREQTKDKGVYPVLETLTLSDGILAPLFDPEVYDYKVVVDSSVDKIGVSAIPKNKGDEVKISGNETLKEGKNEIVISLTSSLGRTRKYTIEVTKSASKEESDTDDKTKSGGIHCKEESGKISLTQSTVLTVEEAKEEDIPSDYEKTSIRIDGISIPAYMKRNDMKSTIFLLYGADSEGNTGFFQYDSEKKIIQPYQGNDKIKDNTENGQDTSSANMQLIVVIVILGIICTVLSVVLTLQLIKKKDNSKDDDDIFKEFKY